MLINCWQAITLTETWEFIKKDPGEYGFMGSNAPEIYTIHSKMEELPNQVGHTGFSFTWTLRQMQYLANNGEESYKQLVLKNCLIYQLQIFRNLEKKKLLTLFLLTIHDY